MTILHDLYRNPHTKRSRFGRSGEGPFAQGQVINSTRLGKDDIHRPNSEEVQLAMERGFLETAFLADWVEMAFLHFTVDADIAYQQGQKTYHGHIQSNENKLTFCGEKNPSLGAAKEGTHTEFLLERYTAFNAAGKRPRFFRVWHQPWRIGQLKDVKFEETSLLQKLEERWTKTVHFAEAHWSFGVFDVWMGRPHAVG